MEANRNHRDASHIGTDAKLSPQSLDLAEERVAVELGDEDGLLGPEGFPDLGITVEIHPEIAGGWFLEHRDYPAVAFPG